MSCLMKNCSNFLLKNSPSLFEWNHCTLFSSVKWLLLTPSINVLIIFSASDFNWENMERFAWCIIYNYQKISWTTIRRYLHRFTNVSMKELSQNFRFNKKSVIIQFIKYESMFSRCIELRVTILTIEKKEFLVKSLLAKL
jgi:hypothetical protein